MEEKYKSCITRLRNGEKVVCEECGNGYYVPYNAPADKAHSFECNKCGSHVHWDPPIDIE